MEKPSLKTELFSFHGEVSRGRYVCLGVVFALIKWNLDRILTRALLGNAWKPQAYIIYPFQGKLIDLSPELRTHVLLLLAFSLPFIWIGVALTVKRLRALGAPLWLVLLFFVPLINFLLFSLLCFAPDRQNEAETTATRSEVLRRIVPKSEMGNAAFAIGICLLLGGLMVLFSVKFLKSYGGGLFVGLPFVLGFIAASLYAVHNTRSLRESLGVAGVAITLCCIAAVGVAFEGIICIAMAYPLALVLACFGGGVAYVLGGVVQNSLGATNTTACLAFFLPLMMLGETTVLEEPELRIVRTSLSIDAPIETVWENVVSFPELPKPNSFLFLSGIAYPQRARIEGSGVGAIRYCEFSTGPFVEPITDWNPPVHLGFSVTESPPPMEEWSPYKNITPPHLDGFFESERGAFHLEKENSDRTTLHGTTEYRNRIWPQWYWSPVSDYIVGQIHQRVLEHIKRVSEEV